MSDELTRLTQRLDMLATLVEHQEARLDGHERAIKGLADFVNRNARVAGEAIKGVSIAGLMTNQAACRVDFILQEIMAKLGMTDWQPTREQQEALDALGSLQDLIGGQG